MADKNFICIWGSHNSPAARYSEGPWHNKYIHAPGKKFPDSLETSSHNKPPVLVCLPHYFFNNMGILNELYYTKVNIINKILCQISQKMLNPNLKILN